MKPTTTFKSVFAMAALVGTSLASAASGYAWNAGTGTGSLVFSQDALGALSTSGSYIFTPTSIPALTNLTGLTTGATNSATYSETTGSVSLAFNNATGVGDTLASLQAANSLVNIQRTILNRGQVVGQNNVYMANFTVDLNQSTVFADLYSSTGSGALVSYGKQAIFVADVKGIVGGTQGNIVVDSVVNGVPTGHASGSFAGNLRMATNTANTVLTALGLATTGSVADLVRNANWGSTSASGVFTAAPAVPEPSSYVLMGMGMIGMSLLRRRRYKA